MPAARHRLERALGHPQSASSPVRAAWRSRNSQHHRRRELRRAAEPAVALVVRRRRAPASASTSSSRSTAVDVPAGESSSTLGRCSATSALDLVDLAAPVAARPATTAVEHLAERRHAVARLRREVGAGEERLAVRRQEHGHRPAALAGHRLGRLHVDGVDVRPLLSVDLDADEVPSFSASAVGRVLERLVRHDVAPVAGGVADREQDRHVALARLRERLVTPLEPVDRVLRVLQQVGAGGARRGGCVTDSSCGISRWLACPQVAAGDREISRRRPIIALRRIERVAGRA